ncbi:MAG: hypothetical protein RBS80_28605, partial [Thermoguttaceae bacterium]|nr:hypothetical protein [Thermoguttaceae bacterium]
YSRPAVAAENNPTGQKPHGLGRLASLIFQKVQKEGTPVELDEDVFALAESPLDGLPHQGLGGDSWAGRNAMCHLAARQVAFQPFRSSQYLWPFGHSASPFCHTSPVMGDRQYAGACRWLPPTLNVILTRL